MAWFVGAEVLLWYVRHGHEHRPANRHRPSYRKPVKTFADMQSAGQVDALLVETT